MKEEHGFKKGRATRDVIGELHAREKCAAK